MKMTYDVYAIMPKASYLVASGSDADHATAMADRVLASMGIVPWGVATLVRGEHSIRGVVLPVEALKDCA